MRLVVPFTLVLGRQQTQEVSNFFEGYRNATKVL